jgi:hypothetical protein
VRSFGKRPFGTRSFGRPGDRWSLARVYLAMIVATLVFGAVGYLFDLFIGPLIGQHGWWTVFALGGTILGAAAQATREFATPLEGPTYATPATDEDEA